MFDTYRRVLRLPGAAAFSGAGLIARLPISMGSLGLILMLSAATGSYGYAGGVSAVYVIANAAAALPLARLVDARGQRLVLTTAVGVSCVSLALVVLLTELGVRTPWLHLLAALSGASMPNVGAAVRARWSALLRARATARRDLDTAFALEAVNDEMVFVIGPTAATLLAAAVHPAAGLITAIAAALVGTLALTRQRRTEPVAGRHHTVDAGSQTASMPWLRLAPLALSALFLGIVFGGVEVATVAFADERDQRGLGGVMLALWALGSLLAGLAVGSIEHRRTPAQRFRLGASALAVGIVPLPWVDSFLVGGLVLLAGGLAISPTLIAAATWVEALTPPGRLNEGLALFTTALVAGVAPGAAIAGWVVDAHGTSVAFAVPVLVAFTGAVLAWSPLTARVEASVARRSSVASSPPRFDGTR